MKHMLIVNVLFLLHLSIVCVSMCAYGDHTGELLGVGSPIIGGLGIELRPTVLAASASAR